MISYITSDKLLEKRKEAVLIGSLQAAVASLLALLQLHGTLKENRKIKGKTKIYLLTFIFKLNS